MRADDYTKTNTRAYFKRTSKSFQYMGANLKQTPHMLFQQMQANKERPFGAMLDYLPVYGTVGLLTGWPRFASVCFTLNVYHCCVHSVDEHLFLISLPCLG